MIYMRYVISLLLIFSIAACDSAFESFMMENSAPETSLTSLPSPAQVSIDRALVRTNSRAVERAFNAQGARLTEDGEVVEEERIPTERAGSQPLGIFRGQVVQYVFLPVDISEINEETLLDDYILVGDQRIDINTGGVIVERKRNEFNEYVSGIGSEVSYRNGILAYSPRNTGLRTVSVIDLRTGRSTNFTLPSSLHDLDVSSDGRVWAQLQAKGGEQGLVFNRLEPSGDSETILIQGNTHWDFVDAVGSDVLIVDLTDINNPVGRVETLR